MHRTAHHLNGINLQIIMSWFILNVARRSRQDFDLIPVLCIAECLVVIFLINCFWLPKFELRPPHCAYLMLFLMYRAGRWIGNISVVRGVQCIIYSPMYLKHLFYAAQTVTNKKLVTLKWMGKCSVNWTLLL